MGLISLSVKPPLFDCLTVSERETEKETYGMVVHAFQYTWPVMVERQLFTVHRLCFFLVN